MITLEEILVLADFQKVGSLYKTECCFHQEKTASLFIYPSSSSFYCYGCSKSGNFDYLFCALSGIDYKIWKAENKILNLDKKQIDFKESLNLIFSRLLYQELSRDKSQLFTIIEKSRAFDKELSTLEITQDNLGIILDKYFKRG